MRQRPFDRIPPGSVPQKPYPVRRCSDEVISECSGVALGKTDAERKCNSSGQGTGTPVHGGRTIHHDKRIFTIGEILLRVPGRVNYGALLVRNFAAEARRDDVIWGKRTGVKHCLAGGDTAQKGPVSFSVMPGKRLSIFEHGLGGLLFIYSTADATHTVPFASFTKREAPLTGNFSFPNDIFSVKTPGKELKPKRVRRSQQMPFSAVHAAIRS